MRLSRAQFSALEVSIPTRSLADRITIMSAFEFSVHTGIRTRQGILRTGRGGIVYLDRLKVRHHRNHQRLRDRFIEADRNWLVQVGVPLAA
jgi:hypothetical protein